MLRFETALTQAQCADWTLASNYRIFMQPNNDTIGAAIGWDYTEDFSNLIQLSLKSVTIPAHSLDTIEKLIAGKWHISRNEDELYTITLTFRDVANSSLYRVFKSLWHASKINYPDDYSFMMYVNTLGRNTPDDEYEQAVGDTIFKTDKAYITSLSQMELSTETNEILEFSVEFKCDEPLWDYNNIIKKIDGQKTDSGVGNSATLNAKSAVSSLINTGLNKLKSYVSDATTSAQQKAMDALGWD
jgi:hypothetical protein